MADYEHVEIEGLAELAETMSRIPAKFQKRIQRVALKAGGEVIEAEMVALCPVAPKASHNYSEPGELRDSIGITTRVDKELTGYALIGPKYSGQGDVSKAGKKETSQDPGVYSQWVEYGRPGHQEPEPFMRPAYARTKDTSVEAYAKVVESLTDLMVGGGDE